MSRTISGRGAIVGLAIFVAVGLSVTVLAWLAMRGPASSAAISAAEEAGREFAANARDRDCVPEALRRADECRGSAMCTVKEQAFLNACIEGAEITSDVCEGVPEKTLYTRSKQWRSSTCARLDHEDDVSCAQIVRVLQRACNKRH